MKNKFKKGDRVRNTTTNDIYIIVSDYIFKKFVKYHTPKGAYAVVDEETRKIYGWDYKSQFISADNGLQKAIKRSNEVKHRK